jgi:hypothetical protein
MFDEAGVGEDRHRVHPLDGLQAVRDDHGGAAAQQPLQRLLQPSLGDRVEAARGLVEQDDAGILEEHAGQRQQLRLAGRQVGAAGAHRGVEAVGESVEPGPESHLVQHLDQALVGDGGIEEGQVVAHGGLEQLHLLRHHPHAAAQFDQRHVARVHAAQQEAPLAGVVEAEQQPGQGGLAAPRAAQQSEVVASGDGQIEPFEVRARVRLRVVVPERHPFEANLERTGRQGGGPPRFEGSQPRALAEQLVDAPDAGPGPLQHLHLLGDLLDRRLQHDEVLEHHVGRAEGDRAGQHQLDARTDGHQHPDHEQAVARQPHDGARHPGAAGVVEEAAHDRDEAMQRVGASPVGAHVVDAGEALLHEAVDLSRGLALERGRRHGDLTKRHHDGDLREGEHRQRQADPRVLEPQHDQDAHQQQQAADHPHRELGEEVGERGDVAVDPLDHLARSAGGVEGHVERQAVLEEVAAQPVGGGPADGRTEDGGGAAEELGPEGDGQEHTGDAEEGAARLRQGAGGDARGGVDEAPEHLRNEELQADAREEQQRQQRGDPGLGREVAPEQDAVASQGGRTGGWGGDHANDLSTG